MLDLKREATVLVSEMKDGGKMSSSAYDTAWVASIPDPHDPSLPMFPSALKWLVDNQHSDGSWGGSIKYHHDRLISTLAALVPLAKYGKRTEDVERMRRGERYFWQNISRLNNRIDHSVGFELLLSAMISRARSVGLNMPERLGLYDEARRRKLEMLSTEALYSPYTTAAHSLEFVGDEVLIDLIPRAKSPNGSLGNSPSATAFSLHFDPDQSSQSYLRMCMAEDPHCAVPTLYPFEHFELMWATYILFLGGLPMDQIVPASRWMEIQEQLKKGGVALAAGYPIPDADDTAVALRMLSSMGYSTDLMVLKNFEKEDCFVSYPYENHPSTGVNVHILDALLHQPGYPEVDKAYKKIIDFLGDSQIDGMYWLDKWHVSPYYATSHAVAVLSDYVRLGGEGVDDILDRAIRWIVNTQNSNGSWSSYGKETNEETAYSLIGLLHYHTMVRELPASVLQQAAKYLFTHYFQSQFETLFIGKALFTPARVVKAAVISALHQYEQAFGSAGMPSGFPAQKTADTVFATDDLIK